MNSSVSSLHLCNLDAMNHTDEGKQLTLSGLSLKVFMAKHRLVNTISQGRKQRQLEIKTLLTVTAKHTWAIAAGSGRDHLSVSESYRF